MREGLANKYLKGKGIEIGGLHFPLPLPPGCEVTYVDRLSEAELNQQTDVRNVTKNVVVDDAEKLTTIADSSLDFLIANHVLEHCHDAIGTLRLWFKKVKPGGIVYAAIPEKTQTFDKNRPTTTIDHCVQDFRKGPELYDLDHYKEYMHNVDKMPHGPDLDNRAMQAYKDKCNIHFHAWDFKAMRTLLTHPLVADLGEIIEHADNGAEIIWVLRSRVFE